MDRRKNAPRRLARRRQRTWPVWAAAGLVLCLALLLLWAGHRDREPAASPEPDGSGLAGTAAQPQAAPDEPENTPAADNWSLMLVNPRNPLSRDYSVTLAELSNGQAVDSRCCPELQEMMDDCRAAGLSPVICSSYRTWEKQESLFNNLYDKLIAQGYSEEDAWEATAQEIAIPGTSEHQLGLAVDIVDKDYQLLDRGQESTAVQKWLMEHCWEYGFILRYPSGKSDVTGIIYEPWHYRYVGKEAAKEITESGICLEEYLGEV